MSCTFDSVIYIYGFVSKLKEVSIFKPKIYFYAITISNTVSSLVNNTKSTQQECKQRPLSKKKSVSATTKLHYKMRTGLK